MKTIHFVAAGALVSLVGCSPTMPPRELVDARTQYNISAQGPAATESPAELHAAKTALDAAERDFQDNGDKAHVRDRAYVALRKAQLADAEAQTQIAQKAKASADEEARRYQQNTLRATQSALQATTGELNRSEAARAEAEKRAQMAMSDLQKIAAVKQEPRGMVITLSGEVLFPSNQSTLLPAAVTKLDEVAEALTKGNPDADITVEGHTDSQGQHDYNVLLSQKRAEAVKSQLVAHGVAGDRIKTVGVGPDRPIADNKSAEGRANNRRVEIVVEPSGGKPSGNNGNSGPSSTTPQR